MRNIFLFVLLLQAGLLLGQKQSIKFSHFLPGNGLSHSFVTSVIQDKNGFMWFGTMDGLNKFDGYTFTVYKNNRNNKNSLCHNYILDLCLDRNGDLWVASWGGLSKFEIKKEVFTQFKRNRNDPESIPNELISAVAEDSAGNIWMASDGGLLRYNPVSKKFKAYRHDKNDPESLGDDYVRDIHIDKQHRMWVGTYAGGLNLFNPATGKFKRFQHDNNNPSSLGNNCVYTIFEDSKGRMWLGSHSSGFDIFDKQTQRFIHYAHDKNNQNSLIHNSVSCFGEDLKGRIWIGTENGGFSVFNPLKNEFFNYQHDEIDNNSLGNNSIYAIYRDIAGNMWVGTYAGGIDLFNVEESKFQHFKHNSSAFSLSNNYVMCFYEDSRGNLWIGTDGGGANLFDRKTGKITCFRNKPGDKNTIAGNYVLSISEDTEGNVWFGTWGSGISLYNLDTKKFRHLNHDDTKPGSLNCENAWIIYRDRKDNMWVGTYRGKGLDLYNNTTGTFTNFSSDMDNPESLSTNYVSFIYEDRKGNFWISTRGGGLNRFDRNTGKFTAYTRDKGENSISSNNVDFVFEDSRGNLWVATDLGLNLWNEDLNGFRVYGASDGLPSEVICGITEDNKGYLWISTINGLTRFDSKLKSFANFTVSDGLQSEEFKPHAALKSRTGAMYFGGINGFNEFYPDSLNSGTTDFPLFLTDLKIYNKSVSVGEKINDRVILSQALSEVKELNLSYDQAFFSFEFSSLNYSDIDKNKYAYMLEGFDKDWNFIGSRRLATYTDIPPGTYTFKVKASLSDGFWKKKERILSIIIAPPFWNTWWFKLLSGIFVFGAAVTFYTVRVKGIEAQKKALEREVEQRTHDLKLAAQEIKSQRDSLKSANEHVMSSINYANSIQKAILSAREKIEATVSDYFIIYKPKDVVSGDFYWFSYIFKDDVNPVLRAAQRINSNQRFIAAVDCTGHGVSGAFMSIIGNTLFNEIVNQKHIFDPAQILEALDVGLKKAIFSSEGVSVAGMDVCLCRIEDASDTHVKVFFAGARRPLYYISRGCTEVIKLNGDIVSIGSDFKAGNNFTTQEFLLEKGSLMYFTTDGFADQNGEHNQKIGSSGMQKLIAKYGQYPLEQQKEMFENTLAEHQQNAEQRDDITVIGVRI